MNERYYKVLVGDYEIGEEDIQSPIGQSDISIVPVISGAGGGVGKTLLGVAMVGLAFATGGVGFAFAKVPLANAGAITGLTGGFLGKAAVYLGASLVISGVTEMLFPLPKPQDFNNEEDPRISFSFSGVQNTSRAGTSHPIVYGEIITGSVVISAGIDTNQVQV